MAVKRIPPRPRHNHPDLVSALVEQLKTQSDRRGPGIADILEQQLTYGNKLSVTVIWDRWEGVGHAERGPIILDAYEKARGAQEMLQVTQALGVTPDEAKRLNIAFPDENASSAEEHEDA
ncbi:MAG: hypothetical protein AB1716_04530 [Planctomycetota bacterium]